MTSTFYIYYPLGLLYNNTRLLYAVIKYTTPNSDLTMIYIGKSVLNLYLSYVYIHEHKAINIMRIVHWVHLLFYQTNCGTVAV